MRKILLTSAGFDNKDIEKVFLGLIGKRPEEIKALFIPTAAIYPDAIAVLPKCMHDLLDAGVPKGNVVVFDLHRSMSFEELSSFDTIYFCGGDPSYLMDRINDTQFNVAVKQYVDNGGVYVGVSAGSMVAAKNLPDSLGFVNCILSVHVSEGSKAGEIDTTGCPHIELTDGQAILIHDKRCTIVE